MSVVFSGRDMNVLKEQWKWLIDLNKLNSLHNFNFYNTTSRRHFFKKHIHNKSLPEIQLQIKWAEQL